MHRGAKLVCFYSSPPAFSQYIFHGSFPVSGSCLVPTSCAVYLSLVLCHYMLPDNWFFHAVHASQKTYWNLTESLRFRETIHIIHTQIMPFHQHYWHWGRMIIVLLTALRLLNSFLFFSYPCWGIYTVIKNLRMSMLCVILATALLQLRGVQAGLAAMWQQVTMECFWNSASYSNDKGKSRSGRVPKGSNLNFEATTNGSDWCSQLA